MAVPLTSHLPLLTLAVVAVAVGTLHYTGTAPTMTTTMAVGTEDTGDEAYEKNKSKLE